MREACGWERKDPEDKGKRKEKRRREGKGHVASCEGVKMDNELLLNQSGYDTWQRGITLF
jgi:hypothetical protein